ncbi:MAG: alpha/beta hydrolase [Chloroflexi bacterium]|nr:alpha/beta hydrolase [Chloroflexota bacterium]
MSGKQHDHGNSVLKAVLGLSIAAGGGWIIYTRLKSGKTQPLPQAIGSERSQFDTPAGRVSYYVESTTPGTPLLLIHSINAAPSAYEVQPLFQHFRQSRPVYAPDLPGFGLSERRDQRYSPELYADTIAALIREEIGQAVDVVALSLGCEFVARAALQHPDWFRSLVFISPTGFNASDVDIPEEALYRIFSFPLWSQPFFDLLITRPSIRFFLNKSFVGEVPTEFVEYAYATAHQPGARYAPLYFVSGQLFTTGVRQSIYSKLDVPTLVLYDKDPNVTFDKLPDLLKENPRWQAVRISPSLGLPHWEKLEETTTALDTFWGSVS